MHAVVLQIKGGKIDIKYTYTYLTRSLALSRIAECLFYKDEEDIIPGFNVPIRNHQPKILRTPTHDVKKNVDNLIK